MPFGDAELLQVYRVYQKLQDKLRGDTGVDAEQEQQQTPPPQTQSSFLKDIGVLSAAESRRGMEKKKKKKEGSETTSNTSETNKDTTFLRERLYLLEAVEKKILPRGFGNALYRNCFTRSQDVSEYNEDNTHNQSTSNNNTNTNTNTNNDVEDEYTRLAR